MLLFCFLCKERIGNLMQYCTTPFLCKLMETQQWDNFIGKAAYPINLRLRAGVPT